MTAKSDHDNPTRYFPRLSSWAPSLSFTHLPQNTLGPSINPGQDQHYRTRHFIQGPWWTSFYRRNTVAPEIIAKKGDTMSQRQLSTIIRGGPLIESWFRHPLDWVREIRQQGYANDGGQCTSISSSSRSSISSTSTTSTTAAESSLSESTEDSLCQISKQPEYDFEILIVWLVAHALLQMTFCLMPEVRSVKKDHRRGTLRHALAALNNTPSSSVEIPACWPPLAGSEIIASAAQAMGPRMANLWGEHEQSMALYKEQFPIRPTKRRSWMRKQRIGATEMLSDATNQNPIMDLARETLEYFEQWYGEQPDSPEMNTIHWLRQVTVA